MGYCVDIYGNKMPDALVKELILGESLMVAHYTVSRYITKRDIQPMHKKIIQNVCMNESTLDLAPRGFGKSTVGDVDHCITRILRDPNIRILIGSKTQTQAEAFLKEVRTHFEQNEDLIRIFGDLRGTPWNDNEFTVNTRTTIKKEATLTALGASGAVVSKHFDVIIGDDLVGFENARTQLQREKLKEWFFSSLYPTLEPNGDIHILGTRYHPLDLYQGMIDSGSYVVQIQKALSPTNKSLWEAKFSSEKLLQIKKDTPLITWNMQYQNDVELAKGSIFKAQYFRYYSGYEVSPEGDVSVKVKDENTGMVKTIPVTVFFGVDLAIREKEQSDYFVLMAIGVSQDNDVYVLKYIKDRLSFEAQQMAIVNMATLFNQVCRIGIETVGYQYALFQILEKSSTLPISEIKTSKDKVVRAQRRSVLFENGKVYFLPDMQDLEENLLLFPEGEHDDLFDGLDFAITASEESHAHILDFMAQEYAKAQAEQFRLAEAARKANNLNLN